MKATVPSGARGRATLVPRFPACLPGMAQIERVRRRARASSSAGVWRKPNPNAQGDEQEPNLRCGTPGMNGYVTAKPLLAFKAKKRELTSRTRGRTLRRIMKELRAYILGWRGH